MVEQMINLRLGLESNRSPNSIDAALRAVGSSELIVDDAEAGRRIASSWSDRPARNG